MKAIIWHPGSQYYISRFNVVQLQTTLCHCSKVRRKCWPIKSSDFLYSKKMCLRRRFHILMQISVKYNWPFVREKHGLENLSNAKYALLQTYYLLCEFFGHHYGLSVMTHIYPIGLIFKKNSVSIKMELFYDLHIYIWVTSKSVSLMYRIWSSYKIYQHSL